MIKVENLEVRFGGVKPIDRMTVTFPKGTCGLIGPNGAGKTTFFNVLSGFVKPSGGTVTAFDENLLAMTDFRRARWGLRRTFQTEQAIEELSLYDNVAMVEEHSGQRRRLPARGRARCPRVRRASAMDPHRRSGRSAHASGAWSRSRAPWSASRAWCCSTSPPPAFPTRRPSTWAG